MPTVHDILVKRIRTIMDGDGTYTGKIDRIAEIKLEDEISKVLNPRLQQQVIQS